MKIMQMASLDSMDWYSHSFHGYYGSYIHKSDGFIDLFSRTKFYHISSTNGRDFSRTNNEDASGSAK